MNKKNTILVHSIFWAFYTILPFLPIIFPERDYHITTIIYTVINSVINIINFYICYFLFGFYSFTKKNIVKTISEFLLIILAFTIFRILFTIGAYKIFSIDTSFVNIGISVIVNELLNTLGFSWVPITIKYTLDWYREQQLKIELKNQNQSSEIAFLRSQINPHFLFNTLNNIYNLALKKSDDAPDAIMKLSDIMRYMLKDTNSDYVDLQSEIEYLNSFINLSKLRVKSNEFVKFDIIGTTDGIQVAPMLFVPFVENAFKHGSKKCTEQPGIEILFKIDNINKTINFICKNCLQKEPVLNKDDNNGIGLHNVERRLELLYKDRHLLKIFQDSDFYNVELFIDTK